MNAWSWAAIGWTGVIFFSSTSIAGNASEDAFKYLTGLFLWQLKLSFTSYNHMHYLAHKSVHLVLFFVLAVLLWKALFSSKIKILLILLIGAVVGTCSEMLQTFFVGRDPTIWDVLINVSSTALGLGACLLLSKSRLAPD